MEIKKKVTGTRVGGRMGERRGTCTKDRDKDNGEGIVFGRRSWMGQGRAIGRTTGTTVTEQQYKN